MIDIKNNFSKGLDLDTNLLSFGKDAYLDALNITRDSESANQDLCVTSIKGNRLVTYSLPAGTNKCTGACPNTLRNTVLYIVYNSNSKHSILEYNDTTRTIVKVFENITDSGGEDILTITENDKINNIDIFNRDEGDLLFFLDSAGVPTEMDITLFKAGEYTPVTRNIINVAKEPPLIQPSGIYGNDITRRTNDLRNKFFRFKYRWVYDTNEKSAFSPISASPMPVKILDDTYTNSITSNNVIYLSLNSGAKNVKSIELCVSTCNKSNEWSDFAVVKNILKTEITGLRASTTEADVPLTNNRRVSVIISGYVAVGTVINIYLTQLPSTQVLVGTYTTVAGDTIASINTALVASITGIGIGSAPAVSGTGFYFLFNDITYAFDEIDITQGLADPDDIEFPFSFYNDSTYVNVPLEESIQLFDWVPPSAKAQGMPNGSVLAYAGITEGYDKDLIPNVVNTISTVAAGGGGATGSLTVSTSYSTTGVNQFLLHLVFAGTPAASTLITLTLGSPLTVLTYTTVAGDTAYSVAASFAAQLEALPFVSPSDVTILSPATVKVEFLNNYTFTSIAITAPAVAANSNSIATWLWSTSRNTGIAYFDEQGRTNGILYNDKVTFPAYAESGGNVLLPYINSKIYHRPPVWAHSFGWYFTKEPTIPFFWQAIDVVTTETDYLYFEVTNITLNSTKNPTVGNVLEYTFKDGDRMRLIKKVSDGTVYADTYDAAIEGQVVAPTIGGVTQTGKTFIKIKKVSPFSGVDYSSNDFIIEIYTPGQAEPTTENQAYFECGQNYPILNAGTDDRVHGGMVTDQSEDLTTPAEFNFYSGDSYFRLRTVYISELGLGTFYVQDRNIVDFYISGVSSLEGRPNAIDVNAKEAYYPALIRFGQAYQANTSINGFNRFYAKNFDEYDYSYGDILRIKVRDRYMKIFQKLKVGMVPLYSSISKDANGGTVIFQTDKLLNPIQYYVGDYGIGTCPESLASLDFSDYFVDNIKGVVCRSSSDGITPLSILYKANSLFSARLPRQTGNYKVYGAINEKAKHYIIAMEANGTDSALTMTFDEKSNSFESPVSYQPEMMCTLGTQLIGFKNGALYTHDSSTYNNFFGVQYNSEITLVFNTAGLEKKTWESITQVASAVWDCPLIYTNAMSYGSQRQESNLIAQDFANLESNFHASFLRDSYSIGGVNNGDVLKGNYIVVKLRRENEANLVSLNIVSAKFIDSPLTPK